MTAIVVVGFEDMASADKVLPVLHGLQQKRLLNLRDWARVVRHDDGRIDVEQAHDNAATGAIAGALFGLMLGLVFMMPFGVLIGGMVGALAGRMTDYGIGEGFIKDVMHQIRPGTSALFLYVDHALTDAVLQELQGYRLSLISSSLSDQAEERLRKAMATTTPA
jgi:uncharacterized membrane protein